MYWDYFINALPAICKQTRLFRIYRICALQKVVTNTHYSMKCNTRTCMCVKRIVCVYTTTQEFPITCTCRHPTPTTRNPAINLWQSSRSVCMYITSVVRDSLINNRRMRSSEARKHLSKRQNTESTKRTKTHNDKHITQGGSEVVFPDKRNK